MREELLELTARLEQLDIGMRKMVASRQQMEEEVGGAAQHMKDKEEALYVKKRTLDLLPDAQNNIAKLQVKIISK